MLNVGNGTNFIIGFTLNLLTQTILAALGSVLAALANNVHK